MELNEYQTQASVTDQTRKDAGTTASKDIVVALLGLSGEVGTLATAYKKFLRDGPSYQLYKENVKEELGDILWYTAILAEKYRLSLEDIAEANLHKIHGRWAPKPETDLLSRYFDDGYPENERIPRKFEILFEEQKIDAGIKLVLTRDGAGCGDPLTDNAYFEDGYRFHDVFHLAYAAILGWSPVTRKLLGCKRRSKTKVDEIEDGGRASVIEEGIAAFVFDYARKHKLLEGVDRVDFEILKVVKDVSSHLEVRERTWHDWEQAIIEGYRVFRLLSQHCRGYVLVDLEQRMLEYRPVPDRQ